MSDYLKTLAVALVLLIMPGTSFATPEIGKPAPAFTGKDFNGNEINLSDYAGKTVVLEWTNHECPYVKKHYDTNNMQTLQKEAVNNDVVWLTVVSSAPGQQGHTSEQEAKEIVSKVGSHETTRVLDAEGTIGQAYDARTTPHMFVVNPEGTLVYMGAIDDNPSISKEGVGSAKNFVKLALNAIESSSPVETASTRPYGCSVKYSVY
jgi:peroxiredoxin